jgi:hypothetical protein
MCIEQHDGVDEHATPLGFKSGVVSCVSCYTHATPPGFKSTYIFFDE